MFRFAMAKQTKQTLRIIGGQWRGRKFHFPDADGLRPTPDRVRETLFNWLMPVIEGASCLDLFCGSGALGLEALSRGADRVMFVDKNRQAIRSIKDACTLVGTSKAGFYDGDARDYLKKPPQLMDIVFIDPPYQSRLQAELARQLEESGWLKPNAWIYIEHDGQLDESALPASWNRYRDKKAGQVNYSLYRNAHEDTVSDE